MILTRKDGLKSLREALAEIEREHPVPASMFGSGKDKNIRWSKKDRMDFREL